MLPRVLPIVAFVLLLLVPGREGLGSESFTTIYKGGID